MPQKQIARLVDQFIEHFGRYLSWNGMVKMPFGSLDDVCERQSLKMDARDLVKQSGPPLAEALAKNHAAESEDVFKMVYFVAEGGGPDNAYAIWPDLRARLKRLAADTAPPEAEPITPDKPILNALETFIIQTLGTDTLTAQEIVDRPAAKDAVYKLNGQFKAACAGLRRRKILINHAPGYELAERYRYLIATEDMTMV